MKINLDGYKSIETHWITLYVNGDNAKCFDSLRVEYITKEIRNFIENKNITINIYKIQAYDSIMCGCFHTWFIDFMLNNKWLADFTNLCSPNNFKANDVKMLEYLTQN